MYGTLIESRRKPERRLARLALSLTLHVALGVGAIRASMHTVVPDDEGPRAVAVFLPPTDPKAAARAEASADATKATFTPPPALPTFTAPMVVPEGIPTIELPPAIDPRRFALAPTTVCVACPDSAGPIASSIFTEASVDQPVVALSQPTPRYPALLQAAGLEGRVVAQFVVDTTGAVERGTLHIVAASHEAFGESARKAILAWRFAPARYRGGPVRQLVRQTLRFALTP